MVGIVFIFQLQAVSTFKARSNTNAISCTSALLSGGRNHKISDSPVQWISFFLRKTLFDFIKSCGGRIHSKFSGVALLGLLYSPKWKRSFFSKGKVPFSMAGSLLRAVQESFSVKEIYRWKEDRFVFFMKKTIGPRIYSFSR